MITPNSKPKTHLAALCQNNYHKLLYLLQLVQDMHPFHMSVEVGIGRGGWNRSGTPKKTNQKQTDAAVGKREQAEQSGIKLPLPTIGEMQYPCNTNAVLDEDNFF